MQSVIIVLIGLSGVGKSTLRDYVLRNSGHNIKKLIAVTTRTPRRGEVEGEDKYFVDYDTFERLYADGQLCVVTEVYGNLYAFYEHDLCMDNSDVILAELHYNAYPAFKKKYNTLSIYIKPNEYVTIQSLLLRGSSQEEHELRRFELTKDVIELDLLEEAKVFDYVFTNCRTETDLIRFSNLITNILEDRLC